MTDDNNHDKLVQIPKAELARLRGKLDERHKRIGDLADETDKLRRDIGTHYADGFTLGYSKGKDDQRRRDAEEVRKLGRAGVHFAAIATAIEAEGESNG